MYIQEYELNISEISVAKNIDRLTNQVWKLIPMWEKEEDWQKQLDTVILEIAGLGELFSTEPRFLSALAKLKGLNSEADTLEFEFYRKTIFEVISLLQEIKR